MAEAGQLHLERTLTELLHSALAAFTELATVDELVLGGGTVLAARWQHRVSTDIDLFTSERVWSRMKRTLAQAAFDWQRDGVVGRSQTFATFIQCELPDGRRFSLGGSDDCTSAPTAREVETTTGIRLHATSEILMRKIRARMVNDTAYVVRDAYDVVCSLALAPDALARAMATLEAEERAALAYDATRESISLNTTQPLMAPSYPSLADANVLQDVMFDVLTGRITRRKLVDTYMVGLGQAEGCQR